MQRQIRRQIRGGWNPRLTRKGPDDFKMMPECTTSTHRAPKDWGPIPEGRDQNARTCPEAPMPETRRMSLKAPGPGCHPDPAPRCHSNSAECTKTADIQSTVHAKAAEFPYRTTGPSTPNPKTSSPPSPNPTARDIEPKRTT
jgi:hypothetical protein